MQEKSCISQLFKIRDLINKLFYFLVYPVVRDKFENFWRLMGQFGDPLISLTSPKPPTRIQILNSDNPKLCRYPSNRNPFPRPCKFREWARCSENFALPHYANRYLENFDLWHTFYTRLKLILCLSSSRIRKVTRVKKLIQQCYFTIHQSDLSIFGIIEMWRRSLCHHGDRQEKACFSSRMDKER